MDEKYKNVHIKFLKEDVSKSVKKVTTVLGKVHMQDIVPTVKMQADINGW